MLNTKDSDFQQLVSSTAQWIAAHPKRLVPVMEVMDSLWKVLKVQEATFLLTHMQEYGIVRKEVVNGVEYYKYIKGNTWGV